MHKAQSQYLTAVLNHNRYFDLEIIYLLFFAIL